MKTGCVRSHENSDGMKSAVESKRTGLVLREREGRTEATGVCVGGKGGGRRRGQLDRLALQRWAHTRQEQTAPRIALIF